MKKILIVAAAGGAIQLEAAAGALAALDDSGVLENSEIEYMACSGGAPVAALHAAGMSGTDICDLIRSTPMAKLVCRPINSRYYDVSGVHRLLSLQLPAEPMRHCRVAVTRERDMKSFMVDATPVTATASMSIQGVIRGQIINGEIFGDGGVKNMIPTPKLREIENYDHIYFLLAPVSEEPASSSLPIFDTEISALWSIMSREITQFHESGWDELDNVTVLEPSIPEAATGRGLLAELLNWSPDCCMIDASRAHAERVLAGK